MAGCSVGNSFQFQDPFLCLKIQMLFELFDSVASIYPVMEDMFLFSVCYALFSAFKVFFYSLIERGKMGAALILLDQIMFVLKVDMNERETGERERKK